MKMTETLIENRTSVDQILPSASPVLDDNEIYVDNEHEVLKATDMKESAPSVASTEESGKSLVDAPQVIDLTGYDEDGNEAKEAADDAQKEETVHSKNGEIIERKSKDIQPSEPNDFDEENGKPKRKSKRESSSKRASSKTGKSKKAESDSKEKSSKKKASKRKSAKKEAVEFIGESSRPIPNTESPTVDKAPVPTKTAEVSQDVPSTPAKQGKDTAKSTPNKKKSDSPDDFEKERRQAKTKRADDLRDYLGTVGDTLLVEPRSDDSVSYLTIPHDLKGDGDHHHVDLNKLPKAPLSAVNPMISMGDDDGELEPERRISYDLEALMSHKVPPKSKENKWENVSVITDDVETVLGENENEVVTLQNNGIKVDNQNSELADIDVEQPSKEATTAVGDCKTESRTLVSTLEELQDLMMRKPIAASVIFVFLVALLVFLGIALMQ